MRLLTISSLTLGLMLSTGCQNPSHEHANDTGSSDSDVSSLASVAFKSRKLVPYLTELTKKFSKQNLQALKDIVRWTHKHEAGEWIVAHDKNGKIIGFRIYSNHALERMAPDTPAMREEIGKRAIGKGIKPGTPEYEAYVDPRDITPLEVEYIIRTTSPVADGPERLRFERFGLRIVTNKLQSSVITVMPINPKTVKGIDWGQHF